jgi:hypothetical protein
MAATISFVRNKTLPDSSSKSDFHDLIDGPTTGLSATISGIEMSEIDFAGADADIAIARTSTTTDAFKVTADSLTSGSVAVFTTTGTLTDAAVKIIADSCTTGDALNISVDALTTGKGINLTSTATTRTADNLLHITHIGNSAASSTGDIAYFEMNDSQAAGVRYVVDAVQNHASAVTAGGIKIQQDGGNATTSAGLYIDHNLAAGAAVYIDTEITSGKGISVAPTVLTTGDGLYVADSEATGTAFNGDIAHFEYNGDSTSTGNVLHVINEDDTADDVVGLLIKQDADDYALYIDNNTGVATTGNIRIDGCSTAIAGSAAIPALVDNNQVTQNQSGWLRVSLNGTAAWIPYWVDA